MTPGRGRPPSAAPARGRGSRHASQPGARGSGSRGTEGESHGPPERADRVSRHHRPGPGPLARPPRHAGHDRRTRPDPARGRTDRGRARRRTGRHPKDGPGARPPGPHHPRRRHPLRRRRRPHQGRLPQRHLRRPRPDLRPGDPARRSLPRPLRGNPPPCRVPVRRWSWSVARWKKGWVSICPTTDQDLEVFVDTIVAAFGRLRESPAEGDRLLWSAYEMPDRLLDLVLNNAIVPAVDRAGRARTRPGRRGRDRARTGPGRWRRRPAALAARGLQRGPDERRHRLALGASAGRPARADRTRLVPSPGADSPKARTTCSTTPS